MCMGGCVSSRRHQRRSDIILCPLKGTNRLFCAQMEKGQRCKEEGLDKMKEHCAQSDSLSLRLTLSFNVEPQICFISSIISVLKQPYLHFCI